MKKILGILTGVIVLGLTACDLQPKIKALPDTVGEFISTRYPALLADPNTQPEIYNSAVTDYGVYVSSDMYGNITTDDYVLYASVDDYTLKPSIEPEPAVSASSVEYGEPLVLETAAVDDYLMVPMYGTVERRENTIMVAKGDTLYGLARQYNMTIDDLAKMNNLNAPYSLSVGQKIKVSDTRPATIEVPVQATKVEVSEISVAKGDTLYSLSRKYSIPVNDLAVMNNLSVPFTLSVGQKLKVPKMEVVTNAAPVPARSGSTAPIKATTGQTIKTSSGAPVRAGTPVKATANSQPKITTQPKISSNPDQKLPTIAKRSSSKFSWPVRGSVLSSYGAKGNGLFNDGINIAANKGTKVGSAENGVVAYAGNEVRGMGNLVIVQHEGGWMTVYAHMDKLSVRRGVKVSVGQQLGTVGETGAVNRPQLHFEIRKGTKAYDPAQYLKK